LRGQVVGSRGVFQVQGQVEVRIQEFGVVGWEMAGADAPMMPLCSRLEQLLSRGVSTMRKSQQKCVERGGGGQRDCRLQVWEQEPALGQLASCSPKPQLFLEPQRKLWATCLAPRAAE